MDYFYLLFAVICIGGQLTLTKFYQIRVGNAIITSLLFTFFSALTASILLAVICGFRISINVFSFLTAAGGVLCGTAFMALGMKMMSMGKVAVYTMFLMLGSMFIPFLYGVIFLNESVTVWKIAGVVLLIIALILPTLKKGDKKDKNKNYIFLGIAVFILNGMVCLFMKIQQISEYAIPTFEYGFWQNLVSVAITSGVLAVFALINKGKKEVFLSVKKTAPNLWIVVMYAIVNQAGAILQLVAAKTVDASVMFPMITGGVMVISALFGYLFFKEKTDRYTLIGLLLAIVSTVCFI